MKSKRLYNIYNKVYRVFDDNWLFIIIYLILVAIAIPYSDIGKLFKPEEDIDIYALSFFLTCTVLFVIILISHHKRQSRKDRVNDTVKENNKLVYRIERIKPMNVHHIKQLIAKMETDSCTPEDKKAVIEALDDLLKYQDDINDIKSGLGYMSAKIKGLEKS